MDILQHLDDLRQNDDPFNDLLEDVRHFNDLLSSGVDRDLGLLETIDDLDLRLDPVDHISLSSQLAHLDNLLDEDFNSLLVDLLDRHLHDLFFDDWHLDYHLLDGHYWHDLFDD